MDEIPMPELLDPDRLIMPERDDMTIDEHRGRAQAALDALQATCKYGQSLRDELIAVRAYLHDHHPVVDADEADWTAWSSRYASVTSVLAGPHGDNGFGAEEAQVIAQYAMQGQTPPPRPE